VVDLKKMQDRGVQVVKVHTIFDGPQAQFVRDAKRLAPPKATAGYPHCEARWIVIALRNQRINIRKQPVSIP